MNSEWHGISRKLLEDPYNIQLWQQLIYNAELDNESPLDKNLPKSRRDSLRFSYRGLLNRYPLLSKYWASFAKWEYKLGSKEEAERVFLDGMRFVSYDIGYWVAYISFKLESFSDNTDGLLQIFEDARYKVGLHYHSLQLYFLYLSFLKRYASPSNNFHKKYILLLRHVIEIPIYDSVRFLRELTDVIFSKNTQGNYTMLLPETRAKEIKKQANNNLNTILHKLDEDFKDIAVTVQYQNYEIFDFEKRLGGDLQHGVGHLDVEHIEIWMLYLDFAEQTFSFMHLRQLYERLLLTSSNNSRVALRYYNLLLRLEKRSLARSLMEKVLSFCPQIPDFQCLICLVDLEISSCNYRRARDLIVNYLEINGKAPLRIYDKLIQIEIAINPADDDYLCDLITQIVIRTKSRHFLLSLENFVIDSDVLSRFMYLFLELGGKNYTIGKELELDNCPQFRRIYESNRHLTS